MLADTYAAEAEVGATAEVMATMASLSLYGPVPAAGGMPTADASAGGDLGSIVVASGGIRDELQACRATGAPRSFGASIVGALDHQPSRMATARVQPAEARSIFTGKHDTMKPVDGSCSRLCNFSMWQ